jgi:hypothetical protein
MHREDQSASWKQLPLAFNPNANPESTSALRLAYAQLKLSRQLTFEQAMSDRAIAIGIRHLADAIARRRFLAAAGKSIGMGAELTFRPDAGPSVIENGGG